MPDFGVLIEQYWQWVFILIGSVFLLGAIFRWSFAMTPTRWEDRYRFHFIPWRVKMGASGAALIVLGIILLIYC